MIVYDGIYRLPTGKDQGLQPRSKWDHAWQVRIIDLDLNQTSVQHLRSRIVVVNQTGSKTCLTSCAESIGQRISRDFDLDVARVLWVEHFPNSQKQWFVAVFKAKSSFGPDAAYQIQWRPIRSNEIGLIKGFIPEVENPG